MTRRTRTDAQRLAMLREARDAARSWPEAVKLLSVCADLDWLLALAAPPAEPGLRAFTGQMTWPCVCGHTKAGHYFGDRRGMDRLAHTWCQHQPPGHCQDFRPDLSLRPCDNCGHTEALHTGLRGECECSCIRFLTPEPEDQR